VFDTPFVFVVEAPEHACSKKQIKKDTTNLVRIQTSLFSIKLQFFEKFRIHKQKNYTEKA
jgi:hypothetical protein